MYTVSPCLIVYIFLFSSYKRCQKSARNRPNPSTEDQRQFTWWVTEETGYSICCVIEACGDNVDLIMAVDDSICIRLCQSRRCPSFGKRTFGFSSVIHVFECYLSMLYVVVCNFDSSLHKFVRSSVCSVTYVFVML